MNTESYYAMAKVACWVSAGNEQGYDRNEVRSMCEAAAKSASGGFDIGRGVTAVTDFFLMMEKRFGMHLKDQCYWAFELLEEEE